MDDSSFDFKRENSIVSSSVAQTSSDVVTRKKSKPIKCMNIFKLALAALPTIVFGVFTIVSTLQQDAAARAARDQGQRQADETNRRILFKEYMDDMRDLLLNENFEQNINKSLLQIRVQTLTVLRNLDPIRKRDVFLFLYESRLIRHDITPRIDIRGADFSGIKLVQSSTQVCDLPFLYLPGVIAENAIFDGCTLTFAVFESASMVGSKFLLNDIALTNFQNTNLNKATFRDNQMYEAKFTGADISQSFIGDGVYQNVDFTNVDLYQSVIGNSLLNPPPFIGLKPVILLNTRLPDGTFSIIDSQNLLMHGRAETECHLNVTPYWKEVVTTEPLNIIHFQASLPVNMSKVEDDCFFKIDKDMTYYQFLSVQNFSHLIDLKLAMFNLLGWFGLKNPNDKDSLTTTVHFSQNKNSFNFGSSVFIHVKNLTSSFHQHSLVNMIPPMTRFIAVSLGCNTVGTNDQFCLFDQITLSVFRKIS
ncbi:unnamed protein product [Rotaria magnacalcarata]|uniref:Pentapeptide repeat-containing protein n=2 Tax=Rotaria magnacalcarata TaxID=392030 RepID=A0A816F6Y3_9BILA|nr:unnamed protein product [Rotaria magnacalcarata]